MTHLDLVRLHQWFAIQVPRGLRRGNSGNDGRELHTLIHNHLMVLWLLHKVRFLQLGLNIHIRTQFSGTSSVFSFDRDLAVQVWLGFFDDQSMRAVARILNL